MARSFNHEFFESWIQTHPINPPLHFVTMTGNDPQGEHTRKQQQARTVTSS